MTVQTNVDKVVAIVGDLPAMPAIVSEVLDMTQDPDVPMSDIGDLIQRDPGLTAKILRISNSPYYGMRQYVGTLKLALVILGSREVRNTVIGIAVFDTLRDDHTDAFLADDFWNHSLTVAALSKKLGNTLSLRLQGEDFIGGLLHDMGKMALYRYLGERYADVFRTAQEEPARLAEFETKEFGFNHADAATAFAKRWNLPEMLCDALYYHPKLEDRPLSEAAHPQLAAVVRIANLASRHDFENETEETCQALNDTESWAILESATAPIPADERYQLLAGFIEEVKDMPKLQF